MSARSSYDPFFVMLEEPPPVEFKVGDVVRFRSGGANMTVINVCDDEDEDTLHLLWTDDDKALNEATDVPAQCVVLINRE